ncbi:MAG TPA: mycofactocin system GMC family oxidoreductase MftG [Dehalococcoidia bacterium]|nr:mycofactocin system GMC family oxidoreductase MftG [Dehalococcoidia bacterium]
MKYDVIVIGAGSAGCALATRLSENPNRSVLLLEAGPDYPDLAHLPDDLKYGYSTSASAVGSPFNWSFEGQLTYHQANPFPVARGKVVGGSSAINGQAFLRGIPEDYDNWASLGNDQWDYLKVLPYFRKMETDMDIRDDFHGFDGPIPIHRHKREEEQAVQSAFYNACVAAGFPEVQDMNHPEATGVGFMPKNNLDGVRMSMALTHLNPNRHRLNLTVRANVQATQIQFDRKRATGVHVESGGMKFIVEGDEIIVSSGAIASPHLLMLSGIGPADQLRPLGIPVLQELNGVGQNLRDHPGASIRYRVKDDVVLDLEGPWTHTVLRYTASGSSARNDMQISQAYPAGPMYGNVLEAEGVRINCSLELPVGAGELRITSTDPHVQPHLDYRYLVDSWDRQRMREGIRLIVQLIEDDAYRDVIKERINPRDEDLHSDDALDAWLLENLYTAIHMSGTCKMGPGSDPMAVVDQHCQVHGLEGIRVVDTSVMPDVVRANTNATAILIGERVSDWIR